MRAFRYKGGVIKVGIPIAMHFCPPYPPIIQHFGKNNQGLIAFCAQVWVQGNLQDVEPEWLQSPDRDKGCLLITDLRPSTLIHLTRSLIAAGEADPTTFDFIGYNVTPKKKTFVDWLRNDRSHKSDSPRYRLLKNYLDLLCAELRRRAVEASLRACLNN